jgi:hypothetical protein
MEHGRRYPPVAPSPFSDESSSSRLLSTFFRLRLAENRGRSPSVAVCHFGFIYRVRKAQSLAVSIRAEDLRRFEALLASDTGA